MRSSFFSRPPFRLTWYTEKRMVDMDQALCADLQVFDLQFDAVPLKLSLV